MNNSINKVLVVLANPITKYDNRSMLIHELCSSYCEGLDHSNIEIDFLDLYREDFNPVHYPDKRDTQTIEYQIRIRKADLIVFFHPIWWGSMPAILKGFCEKVFQSGFAYSYQQGRLHPLLSHKKAHVIAVAKEPSWKIKFIYSNTLMIQWKRAIFDICGIKSKFTLLDNLRKVDNTTIQGWKTKLRIMGENVKEEKSALELI